jgi:hypothetical protein
LKRRTFLATSTSTVALAPSAAAATVAPRSRPQWATTVPITGPAVPQLAVFDRVMTGLLRTYGIPGGQCAVAKTGGSSTPAGLGM